MQRKTKRKIKKLLAFVGWSFVALVMVSAAAVSVNEWLTIFSNAGF